MCFKFTNAFTMKLCSSLINKWVYKRIKKNLKVKINSADFDFDDKEATANINVQIKMDKNEFAEFLMNLL